MKRKMALAAALAVLAGVAAGLSFATPPRGLGSQLLSRGAAAGELSVAVPIRATVTQRRIVRVRGKLRIKRVRVTRTVDRPLLRCGAASPCDVAVVRATLEAGGSTGWHSHPLPSLVVVKAGQLTLREPRGGQCATSTFNAGQAFVHPARPHSFENAGGTQLEFYVTYFAPPQAGLLIDAPAPTECP